MRAGVSNQSSRRREPAVEKAAPGRLAGFLDEHRAGVGAVVVALSMLGLGWAAWSRLGDRVRGSADLVLHPDAITVTGVAPWVRADLKAEALRDASLDAGLPHFSGNILPFVPHVLCAQTIPFDLRLCLGRRRVANLGLTNRTCNARVDG